MRGEVEERLLREKSEGLEPDLTHWVIWSPSGCRSSLAMPNSSRLASGGSMGSRPGEVVFEDQPPQAPDAPPQ